MKTNPCKKPKQQKCFISLPKFLKSLSSAPVSGSTFLGFADPIPISIEVNAKLSICPALKFHEESYIIGIIISI